MAHELTVQGQQISLHPQKMAHSRHSHGKSAQPSMGLGFMPYTLPAMQPVLGKLSRAGPLL